MEYFDQIFMGLIVIQTISAGVMCVYGYKWSKGLIATTSLYLGLAGGVMISYALLENDIGIEALWAIPITMVAFWLLAYRNIKVNHFIAGFLLAMKISFMLIMLYAEMADTDIDVQTLFALPLVIGLISGLIMTLKFNNQMLLICVAYIGASEFVPKIMDFINKTMFVVTSRISFIFDPEEVILGLFGIELPSAFETVAIIGLFIGGYFFQKYLMQKEGIELKAAVIDDRGPKNN